MNYDVRNSPWSVVAADLDCDGAPDLASANTASGNISILLNGEIVKPVKLPGATID